MSDFQQTITSLNLLHTSLCRMELFTNAQAVKNVKTDVISIISRLEAAERERDELRAELTRRDAAAGEPVAWQYRVSAGPQTGWSFWGYGKGREYEKSYQVERRPLYTAAQPAALPPEMKPEPDKYDVIDHGFIAGYNKCRSDALALGAQQQKVVFMPVSIRVNNGYYFDMDDIFVALDAAGVKWEVKS